MADIPLDQYGDKTNFGLYSHAAETAAALPQSKGTPQQFKSMLMKQGVKPAEFDYSNYDDVFANRPSVTKDELVQHFRQSMPIIKEHVSGAKPAYPQHLKDKEQNIIDSYKPRISDLRAASENYSLSSAERAEARESLQDLYDQMQSHIDREIPERGQYLDDIPTKFHKYTMPGGENYREVRLQLERGEDNYERMAGEAHRRKTDLINQYADLEPGDPRGPEISAQIREATQQYNQLLNKSLASQRKKFVASHWDEPDVLAHLRMKDRQGPNGEKILHVDEIQSDWGQQGRNNGFADPNAEEKYEAHVERMRERFRDETKKAFEESTKGQNLTPEDKERILAPILKNIEKLHPMTIASGLNIEDEHKREVDKLNNSSSGIPHGPYVTNTAAWTDLALKRALHEAASGGYDKVIFTNGEDQAERYDLRKHIGSIEAYPTSNGMIELKATDPYGEYFVHDDVHEPKELPNIVGKEIADKIMQKITFPKDREGYIVRNKKSGHTSDTTNTLEAAQQSLALFPASLQPDLEIVPRKWREAGKAVHLDNLDLKVGGEGMKAFYDKLVPKQLMEITKRHDPEVKVKPDVVDTPEGPKDVHAIDITPKLREGILRGQRAFADGGAVDDEGITAYHGSPHDFDKFDISKIGTGEGAQAFGHGLYFAQAEPTAREYRDNLTDRASNFRVGNIDMPKWILRSIEMAPDRNAAIANHRQDFEKRLAQAEAEAQSSHQPWLASGQKSAIKDVLAGLDALERGADLPHTRGRMYEVHINAHPDHFLDWDKPIYQQPEHIQNSVQKALAFAAEQAINGRKSLSGRSVNSENNTVDAHPDDFLQHDGATIQYMLQRVLGAKGSSDALHANGVKGIKYLDANSRTPPPNLDPDHVKRQIERNRAQAAQTIDEAHRADLDDDHQILLNRLAKAEKARARNYVVFDDKLVRVKRKYARGGGVPEYPLAEKTEDHLTYMSPDEFLEQTRPLKDTEENKRTIETFEKGMKQGHKLDPLALYPDNQENGRHRATAAKRLGIKKVPVHNYRKGKKKGGVVDRALMIVSCQPKGSGDAR